jgi:hypothetical protein
MTMAAEAFLHETANENFIKLFNRTNIHEEFWLYKLNHHSSFDTHHINYMYMIK